MAPRGAFTLIELLVVIAIAGILAALSVPAIKEFGRTSAERAATRQLLDDVGRARQLAIVNRTTVYMVFLPPNFHTSPSFTQLSTADLQKAKQLLDMQMRAYALISLRTVGDQPGQYRPRYLSEWTELPQGWFIPLAKFNLANVVTDFTNYSGQVLFRVAPFQTTVATNGLPFPSADGYPDYVRLPYIAFNYLGQLESGQDEYIPLARGTVDATRDANGNLVFTPLGPAAVQESPPGNSLETFNVVHIDWLTGRARLLQREIE
jgi:prepilin-type N-terminal cleavage/methylation domain-containing protein